MNTPLVSVIVPVYNVEKTLARCLESICGQSYQNLEIIVVNDDSPDGSLAICEQFRAKDPRVVVISKENEGLSLTRNAGMRTAHGKYLQFVDSDDYIEPTFTARMVEAAEKNYADLVIAPYWMVIPLASSKSGRRTEKLLAQLGVQTDTAEPEVNVYSFHPRSLQRGSAVQCAVFPAGEGLYRPCRPGLLLHPKPPEPAAHQCRP